MTSHSVPLLKVSDLTVTYSVRGRRKRTLQAVNEVSFEIAPGETLALVGESGSGKSTTARGVLQLLDSTTGTVELNGVDVTALTPRELKAARRDMQMVFQDPYSSLDPSMTVADSIAEPLLVHTDLDKAGRQNRVLELLTQVGLRKEHANRYPHEFSGGQRQRIAIARAVAVNPQLIIADEAVSALDVSSQNQIIRLMERLSTEMGIGYLFISHDLAVVRHIADRVAVMYLGRIVEEGPTDTMFASPAHPYTEALLSSALVANPVRQAERRRVRLVGELPDPANPPKGCSFNTRCPRAMSICREEVPAMTPLTGGGQVRCHLQTTGPFLAGERLGHLDGVEV